MKYDVLDTWTLWPGYDVCHILLETPQRSSRNEMNNEKSPDCLGYKGDCTTQFYRDSNRPL